MEMLFKLNIIISVFLFIAILGLSIIEKEEEVSDYININGKEYNINIKSNIIMVAVIVILCLMPLINIILLAIILYEYSYLLSSKRVKDI